MREVILRLRRDGGEINIRMTDVPRDDAAQFLTMLVVNGWVAPSELGLPDFNELN